MKNSQFKRITVIAILSAGIFLGCAKKDNTDQIIGGADSHTIVTSAASQGDKMTGYKSITMKEAQDIFETSGDYVILDVRRPDEYESGHIPGAINFANEDINTEPLDILTDMDQVIYVYCRSGRRSKKAASKLSKIGYTNIIEFGGIIDWKGDIEK